MQREEVIFDWTRMQYIKVFLESIDNYIYPAYQVEEVKEDVETKNPPKKFYRYGGTRERIADYLNDNGPSIIPVISQDLQLKEAAVYSCIKRSPEFFKGKKSNGPHFFWCVDWEEVSKIKESYYGVI